MLYRISAPRRSLKLFKNLNIKTKFEFLNFITEWRFPNAHRGCHGSKKTGSNPDGNWTHPGTNLTKLGRSMIDTGTNLTKLGRFIT